MIEIYNGRELFYQWDINQKIKVNTDFIKEIHFDNGTGNALVCAVYDYDGQRVAEVPNILLTNYWAIKVYAYCGECVRFEKVFEVEKRNKPIDYVYTETEIKRYETLEERIAALENGEIVGTGAVNSVNGKAGDVVLTAADVGALPNDTVIPVVPNKVSAFANDAGYLQQSSLAAIEEDISDNTSRIEDLEKRPTGGAKLEVDTEGNATIESGGVVSDADLSNYYTKEETEAAIDAATAQGEYKLIKTITITAEQKGITKVEETYTNGYDAIMIVVTGFNTDTNTKKLYAGIGETYMTRGVGGNIGKNHVGRFIFRKLYGVWDIYGYTGASDGESTMIGQVSAHNISNTREAYTNGFTNGFNKVKYLRVYTFEAAGLPEGMTIKIYGVGA